MATRAPTLDHATVGRITGIVPPKYPQVEQYLGVQYAKLANRFARGTPVEKSTGDIEATSIGRLPVADPKNCDNEHLLLQHALPHPEYEFSDTECLTLNLSAPSLEAKSEAKGPLPVVVFVHGGGFVTGSANWPQWDLAPLVEHSVKIRSPIIAVGINYRLGVFGWLTSSAMGEAGFKPNNGLDDQKLGLRWVQKHISGFGGDPERVTFLGSSVGAASGFFHLQSTEPLFSQLVAMAGSPLVQPVPLEVAEFAYGLVTQTLGLDGRPPAEQVRALLDLPAADLQARLAGAGLPLGAVVDGDLVTTLPTFARLAPAGPTPLESLFPGARHCRRLLASDGQFDGMVMGLTALAGRADNLAAALRRALEAVLVQPPNDDDDDDDDDDDGAARVDAVLSRYGVGDEAGRPDDRLPVLHFINDVVFAQGATAVARAWAGAGARLGTAAFLARFNLPNPWEGPWRGHASHALDAAVLLGNYAAFLGPGQRTCGARMAADLVAFAHGREPFPPYSGARDGTSMVYYAGADSTEDVSHAVDDSDESESGRRGILEDIAGGQPEVLDKLLAAFGLLVQGPN